MPAAPISGQSCLAVHSGVEPSAFRQTDLHLTSTVFIFRDLVTLAIL